MNSIEMLRELEGKAHKLWSARTAIIKGNGWDVCVRVPRGWSVLQHREDAELAATLRNLAPELLALWECAIGWSEDTHNLSTVKAALEALNARAAEVLGEVKP